MVAKSGTRNINIRLEGDTATRGINKLNRQFAGLSGQVAQVNRSIGGFQSVLMGLGAAVSIRGLITLTDNLQLLRDRVRALFPTTTDANQVLGDLYNLSKDLNTPMEQLAQTFTRTSVALADLGIEADAAIAFTSAMTQTFRISGANMNEARSAIIQLTQGMAGGSLRGRELRAVLQENGYFASILANELGVVQGELIKTANDMGGIPAERLFEIIIKKFPEIQEQARKVGVTFGQAFAKLADGLSMAFFKLTDTIKGAKILDDIFQTTLSSINVLLELTIMALDRTYGKIMLVVGGVLALTLAAMKNPLLALLTGISVAFVYLFENVNTTELKLKSWVQALLVGVLSIIEAVFKLGVVIGRIADSFRKLLVTRDLKLFAEDIKDSISFDQGEDFFNPYIQAKKGFHETLEQIRQEEIAKEKAAEQERARREAEQLSAIERATEKFKEQLKERGSQIDNFKTQLIELNKQFSKDNDIDKYEKSLKKLKIDKVNIQFNQGGIDRQSREKQLNELERDLGALNRAFADGQISLKAYQETLRTWELDKVNEELKEGNIQLQQAKEKIYEISKTDTVFQGIKNGVEDYTKSIGGLAKQVGWLVSNTFQRMEDSLVQFVETGKFRFADFANAVISDLTRVMVRMAVMMPLMQAMGVGFGMPGFGSPNPTPVAGTNAHGGAFEGGVKKFAKGGIVSSATLFPMSKGMGMMGEAGPEAIVPLKRTSGGDLGVQATPTNVIVNVQNLNAEANEVDVQESTDSNGMRTLDIYISKKAAETIASGKMDRIFSQRFGLRPRGV